jgi:hypothetical protein
VEQDGRQNELCFFVPETEYDSSNQRKKDLPAECKVNGGEKERYENCAPPDIHFFPAFSVKNAPEKEFFGQRGQQAGGYIEEKDLNPSMAGRFGADFEQWGAEDGFPREEQEKPRKDEEKSDEQGLLDITPFVRTGVSPGCARQQDNNVETSNKRQKGNGREPWEKPKKQRER